MDFTSSDSSKLLTKLINMLREQPRPYADIARHPVAQSFVVRKRIEQQAGFRHTQIAKQLSEAEIGIAIVTLIVEIIEGMKPTGSVKLNNPEWIEYLLLHNYVVEHKHHELIEQELGIGTTKFYKARKKAESGLALRIQLLEDRELHRTSPAQNNLRKSTFYYNEFVRRYDPRRKDHFDEWITNELIRRPGWVITLYGPAGVGKTALAYRVAERFRDEGNADAVIWTSAKEEVFLPFQQRRRKIDFAQTTFDSILDTIGKELGNREVLNKATLDKKAIIEELLRDRIVLLIIDNLESLEENVRHEVEDFLAELPLGSRCIVTAREHLLAPERPVHIDSMLETEAVQLINSTGEIVGIPTPLTDKEKREIIKITDGNPLLIQNSIGYLKRGGTIDELKRFGQGTVLNYMYDEMYENMLSDDERKVLITLSLVPESLSISSLLAATAIKESLLRASLQGLRELALVRGVVQDSADHAGTARYELPPAPREFIQKIASSSGLKIRGARQFVNAAYQLLAEYYSASMKAMVHIDNRIDYQSWERNNIIQAMRWCYENERWPLLTELEGQMGLPMAVLGYLRERIEWGEKARVAFDKIGNAEGKAWVEVYDIGWSYVRLGEVDKASKIFERMLPHSRREGLKQVEAITLRCLGILARDEGKFEEGRDYLEDSLKVWQELSLEDWVVSTVASLGRLHLMMGDLPKAKEYLMTAYSNAEKIGHRGERAETASDLAVVLNALGERKSAKQLITESYKIISEVRPPAPSRAHIQACHAQIEQSNGHIRKAQLLINEALQTYHQLGMETSPKANYARRFIENRNPTR